jgi:hypothetical protein
VTLYLRLARRDLGAADRLVLYALLRSRAAAHGAAAVIPAAVAVKVAYGADLLANADYDTSAAAASQGCHVGAR